jgi:hypothetical protein
MQIKLETLRGCWRQVTIVIASSQSYRMWAQWPGLGTFPREFCKNNFEEAFVQSGALKHSASEFSQKRRMRRRAFDEHIFASF